MDSEKGAEMIIGVSAKKQGGKSTFVNALKEKIPDWRVIRFADKLKEIVIDCFVPSEWHWTIDDLDSDEKKNTILPCGRTVRYLLQIIGTDQFRHLWESCWINAYGVAVSKVEPESEVPPVILTPDVRFPNELRYIQEHGRRVIRLTRAPHAEDEHESETALDPAMWATILHWDKLNVEQSIQKALTEGPDWVVNLLAWKKDTPALDDLRLIWDRNPVLFDQIRDNNSCTMEEQRQWIVNSKVWT